MTRRLRVWVVTPELHRLGGTERCLTEQVERWRERFDLRLYTMRAEGVDLAGIAVRRIPRLPLPHLPRYLWWFVANTAVRRWDAWRLGAPDVVHSPGINCLDADAMSVHIVFGKYWERAASATKRRLRRLPTALRAAHRLAFWFLIRALERVVYTGPATVWAISREDAAELERRFHRPPGTVPAIPHGVDTARFSLQACRERRAPARARLGVEGRRVLLLVGNDAVKKGVDAAIRALPMLPDDVVLALAGRMDRDIVEGWARKAGVTGRVLLWPHTPDVLDYYAAADIFIAPSREDAFHQPALEALACGLPAVVSAKAGASEVMEDGRHALILREPESADDLAVLVRRLLVEGETRTGLSREGRALAERHSWDANAARTAELIEREAATPRFLVLAPDAWGTGGIERATRTLLHALADLYGSERVGLLSVWGGVDALPARLIWRGREKTGAGRTPLSARLRFALASVVAARRWRRRLVVIACHPHLASVARLAAWAAGAPLVVWSHGEEVWRPLRSTVRAALRTADLVIAPSRFTRDALADMHRLSPARLAILPHALPPELPLAAGDGASIDRAPRVLTVARLVREHAYKGIDTLLAAWARVRDEVPEAELVVVGDGSDRPRLQQEAARLGLDGSVRFMGQLNDQGLAEAYRRAQVFAMPARTRVGRDAEGEGFGLVFLEAAAAGLPVVAGNGGAIPEVVRDGETGYLVDPRAPEQVAEAIVRLLSDPGLARRMGDAGRRWAHDEFSYGRFRERVNELIARVSRMP